MGHSKRRREDRMMWWIYVLCLFAFVNCNDVRVHKYISISNEDVYRKTPTQDYHELEGPLTIDLYQYDEFQCGHLSDGQHTGYTINMKGYRYGLWLETTLLFKTQLAYKRTKIYIDQLQ